jgi:hypothetical protein
MRGNILARRGSLARRGLFIAAIAILATGFHTQSASGDGVEGVGSLADHGVRALEKLPYEAHIVQANLGKRRPMSIAACYLMDTRVLVVSAAGRLYCMDRRNLEPRWVNTLRFPLAQAPTESSTHYLFLMKDHQGAHWLQAISKRTGAADDSFPVRLPFAAVGSIAANSSLVFVPSLGSPNNSRTLETINTVSGKRGWGYRTTGILMGGVAVDPGGDLVILAADDGVVTALSGRATAPNGENWIRDLGGIIRGAPAVTPAHVLVGNHDGILYNLDLYSGKINWIAGLDEPIRKSPVVFGALKEIEKSTGVDGAAPIKVKRYVGTVFARNVLGLHAVDLESGKTLFTDAGGGRPVAEQGKYLMTCDKNRKLTIRDSSDGYKVTGSINLNMFDLIPTNTSNGEIFACTSDGTIVAVIPK